MRRVILVVALSVFLVITTETGSCRNPNGRLGTCVSIEDCQTLFSLIQRTPVPDAHKDFIRASQCFYGYYVCCTGDTGFWHRANEDFNDNEQRGTQPRFMAARTQMSAMAAVSLPHPPMCGGVTISNRIYNGMDTGLFEFPWMALLEYKRASKTFSTSCSGSLINHRYVLTAAHCLTATLTAVLLGEYDTTKLVDCIGSLCAPARLRVAIEERIPHESFDNNSANKRNDIALLRLRQRVSFTDSIRPICLPSAVQPEATIPASGTLYTVAGWGETVSSRRSGTKQKLQIPLVDLWECQQKFRERRVNVLNSQICAGGKFGEDSCKGDSGSPLMRFRNSAWILEGIVSFGYRCGLEGWPAVHTSVAYYDDWIRSKLRQ